MYFTAPACFKSFLCVSAKIRRRRICHLRVEGGERQGLAQVLKPQMAKGPKPLALTQSGFLGFGWNLLIILTLDILRYSL
jgi:hypothetical protein